MSTENKQFIILMAILMSLTALAIDAMLPALGVMQASLKVKNSNDMQFVISAVFFGMAFGLIFYGPLSDAIGRKKPLYLGLVVFICGSFVSAISTSLEVMLLGRFLQGFGTAASRVVSLAMIRDKFSGAEMGKVMSLILVIFIIVPAIAPALGQGILALSNWNAIFYVFMLLGLLCYWLLYSKQEETLVTSARIPFSIKNLKLGVVETLTNRYSRNYTLASGFTSGAFVGYLATSQQILQVQFKLGDQFSLYFGILAICIGLSSFANSRLVLKHGLYKLSLTSLRALFSISVIYLTLYFLFPISHSLIFFMIYLCSSFLFVGVLFGNLSTMAIEPLGHIAGIANSVISSIQTLISVVIGAIVGSLYTDNVLPLVLSFMFMSLFALMILMRTKQKIEMSSRG